MRYSGELRSETRKRPGEDRGFTVQLSDLRALFCDYLHEHYEVLKQLKSYIVTVSEEEFCFLRFNLCYCVVLGDEL